MREDQADRLIKAVEDVARVTGISAAMLEEQNLMLGDIHRRLAELAEAAENGAAGTGSGQRRKPPRKAGT
jgi:hypothetical protein